MKDNIYNYFYVKRLFNNMSKSYERMNYITSFGFSKLWRNQFLNKIKTQNNKLEIIDLLTGMGETWNPIKNKFKNYNLTAVDFSEGMLKYAEIKNKTKFNNTINILNKNVLENDLPNNYYDVITCSFGLKTFNNEQLRLLAIQINKILKKNGQFTFIEVSIPENKILKILYKSYLKYFIPFIGKILLGNPDEYKMLWKYLNRFKNSKNAMKIFSEQGFILEYNSYFYGCATGFSGTKSN